MNDDNANTESTEPESREDWERKRDELAESTANGNADNGNDDDDDDSESKRFVVPDDDDVEPGTEPEPTGDDGKQDDPDDDPVDDPEPGDDEPPREGKLRRR